MITLRLFSSSSHLGSLFPLSCVLLPAIWVLILDQILTVMLHLPQRGLRWCVFCWDVLFLFFKHDLKSASANMSQGHSKGMFCSNISPLMTDQDCRQTSPVTSSSSVMSAECCFYIVLLGNMWTSISWGVACVTLRHALQAQSSLPLPFIWFCESVQGQKHAYN